MDLDFNLSNITGFDWNEGNINKNKIKYNVRKEECEQAFTNQPIKFFDDKVYTKNEKRFGLLGKTDKERYLDIIFTIRNNKIRIISARNQGKKDKKIYQKAEMAFVKSKGVKNEKAT